MVYLRESFHYKNALNGCHHPFPQEHFMVIYVKRIHIQFTYPVPREKFILFPLECLR